MVENRLSAIAAEMVQLQNEIKEGRKMLNFLLRSVRRQDPAIKEERIRVAREHVADLQERARALEEERQGLIVQFVTYQHGGN